MTAAPPARTWFVPARTLLPEGLRTGVAVAVDHSGTVLAVSPAADAPADAVRLAGILSPGFVNAHCHLELSHLQGVVPPGIGMVPFIESLQAARQQADPAAAAPAAASALQAAARTGTVALADIANTSDSFAAKQAARQAADPRDRVHVHTFVELFGGGSAQADARFAAAQALLAQAPPPASLTPHAPYSVSPRLFALLRDWAAQTGGLQSLHLLESRAERQLFAHRDGEFAAFFQRIGLAFEAEAPDPWAYVQPYLAGARQLLVHLTEATPAEMAAIRALPSAYRVLCPRSNLFLHHRLPDLAHADFTDGRLCLGTDSLASNWSLDLLRECVVLQQHHPSLTTETLLFCASRNGADAVGMGQHLGSIRPGAAPGLVHVDGLDAEGRLRYDSTAVRLA